MQADHPSGAEAPPERAAWMSVLAKAPAGRLAELWAATGLAPGCEWLRRPESGAVMVRGRAGGTGAPFNLGEMPVTRCALRLESGEVGHAWAQGRDKEKARIAALCDALMATPARGRVEAEVLGPLRAEAEARARARAARAAATKVDFFTMVRGEDA
ncbi:MAG: phosphonate C-P lyase system protein PhnG [Pseudomonadota bacterium]